MTTNSKIQNHILITEMILENSDETLYEITFHGTAEDYGFSDTTDYLTAVDAEEIAKDVQIETNAIIAWEGTKPSGMTGVEI